jgi:hypothetical protein
VQGLIIRAGRPIHEMGASVLFRFLPERGLTAMRNGRFFVQHGSAAAITAVNAKGDRLLMKMKRRLLSSLLSLALALGLMPGMSLTAYADGAKAYADYDVTTDANKYKSGNDLTALQVTFNDFKWYIIEDNSTAVNAGTVTLLAADTSFGSSAFDSTVPYSNVYSSSTVKGMLDGYTESGGSFAGVAEAIETISLTTPTYDGSGTHDTASNVKLYLLSKEEANSLPGNVRKSKSYWWLRSPGELGPEYAAYVFDDGFIDDTGSDVEDSCIAVRPALRLRLASEGLPAPLFTCPGCGEVICFDETIDPENLTCPACNEKFACDIETE